MDCILNIYRVVIHGGNGGGGIESGRNSEKRSILSVVFLIFKKQRSESNMIQC